MKALELPPTVRTARADEVTPHEEVLKRLQEREGANLVEGYTFQYNPVKAPTFRFFSEINIDNSRLWSLFQALVLQMPEEVSVIYGHVDDEPAYGRYTSKHEVLDKLSDYKPELTQDGFLELGVIYQDEQVLEEVFIKKAKYLQVWGTHEKKFRDTMNAFHLKEVRGLNFIDDFPLATEVLTAHLPGARETKTVVQALQKLFA